MRAYFSFREKNKQSQSSYLKQIALGTIEARIDLEPKLGIQVFLYLHEPSRPE